MEIMWNSNEVTLGEGGLLYSECMLGIRMGLVAPLAQGRVFFPASEALNRDIVDGHHFIK